MILLTPLRKKGGIIIKKLKFFLIIIILVFTAFIPKVKAIETANFYEAEYIDGIYMNRYDPKTRTTYYQKARFFRRYYKNIFSYCVDPFAFFNTNVLYTEIEKPPILSVDQMKRITKIAHFGYNYKDHTDVKWYAITQLMIWRVSEPNADFYFTDSLNGNRINAYESEIQEINNLIYEYDNSFNIEKEYNLVEDESLSLTGNFKYIQNNYNELQITDTSLTSIPLKEKEYNFKFTKKDNYYNSPYIFFTGENTQTQLQTGDFEKETVELKVNVKKTSLTIKKIDEDTNTTIPSGEGELNNSVFQLLDNNKNLIQEFTPNTIHKIDNLGFNTYYIKEIKPGVGYTLNEKIYQIDITPNNPIIELAIPNKIIEKKIIIQKKYGETNNLLNESNITFRIYNSKHELVKELTTNEEGIIETILPYGEYEIVQLNTTDGYQINDPFQILVNDTKEEYIELKDYRIKVPDTYTNNNILLFLIKIILSLC